MCVCVCVCVCVCMYVYMHVCTYVCMCVCVYVLYACMYVCMYVCVCVCVCVCVYVALGIQHAMRMRLVILSSVACPALQYFSTLSHQKAGCSKNKNKKSIEHKMCILIFSTTFI